MALPATGPLSFQDFNTDRGLSSTAQVDIDTAAIAYGIPTKPHGMDEFRGRSVPSTPPPPPPPSGIPTYAITGSPTVVDEGGSFTFTIVTTNVGDDTIIYWTTNTPDAEENTPVAGDFTDGLTQGSITINSNGASLIRTLVEDLGTEGDEVFIIRLREGSTSGAILATSNTVIISDTSQSPPPPPPPPPPAPCFLITGVQEGTSVSQVCSTPRTINGYFNSSSVSTATAYYGPSTLVSDCSTLFPSTRYFLGDGGYYIWNGSSMSGPFLCP